MVLSFTLIWKEISLNISQALKSLNSTVTQPWSVIDSVNDMGLQYAHLQYNAPL